MAEAPLTSLISDIVAVERAALQAIETILQGLVRAVLHGPAQMQAAIDRVHPDVAGTIAALSTLARFAVNNPDYVRAAVDVLSIATQEAETFFDLTGPQKQAYVQEMILALLEQNGLIEPSGLWREIVKGAVNLAIDATVAIFNRRHLFTPRRRAHAAPAVP